MSLASDAHPESTGLPRERIQLTTSALRSSVVLITAVGEVDAANALRLGTYVESGLSDVSRLVVDLHQLTFFGTQGFSILHRINVMCSRHLVNWTVLAGAEVDRVLRICDPDGGLPVAHALDEAVAAVIRPPRNHLRLITCR